MANFVYRGGSLTDDNFTPRPETDTIALPGRPPGLSTYSSLEMAVEPGGKAQEIDLELLQPLLRGFPDQKDQDGIPGHVSIAPATPDGILDYSRLKLWAATRRTGVRDPVTNDLLGAIVRTNVRRPK